MIKFWLTVFCKTILNGIIFVAFVILGITITVLLPATLINLFAISNATKLMIFLLIIFAEIMLFLVGMDVFYAEERKRVKKLNENDEYEREKQDDNEHHRINTIARYYHKNSRRKR